MRTSDKHQKIIKAATQVFARKGFSNARISDIAKAAKVADGTIYLYFNNKYDILTSLFDEGIGHLNQRITAAIQATTDPRARLAIFALEHLSLLENNRDLAEVLQVELRQCSIFQKEYRNKKLEEYLGIISSIVHEGQMQGLFRAEIDLDLIKRAYFGALDETSRLWIFSESPRLSIDETARQISNIFVSGLTVK